MAAAIASATALVASSLERRISALRLGDHRVAMGSPARLTTPPRAPSMALAQSFFAWKVSLGMPASLLAEAAGSRVRTRTLTPRATRRRTSLAPTVPVAPVMATSPLIPAA